MSIDIDATVAAANLDLDAALDTLATHGIVPRIPNAPAFAHDCRPRIPERAPPL